MNDPSLPAPEPPQIQVPLVLLHGTQLRIDGLPNGERMLVVGPVALGLPLSPETEAWLERNLSAARAGIVIPNGHL